MNTIDAISQYIEDDWYGRLYLQTTSFNRTDRCRKSLSGVNEYTVRTRVDFNDYTEEMSIYVVKPSERGRVVYFSNNSCRLCDENSEPTTKAVSWTKIDGKLMMENIALCGLCINRINSIVDKHVYENEDVREELLAGLL